MVTKYNFFNQTSLLSLFSEKKFNSKSNFNHLDRKWIEWLKFWSVQKKKDEKEKLCGLRFDGVTVRASNDIRVHVVRLVLGSIPSCNICGRYTFGKFKNYSNHDSNRHNYRVCHLTLVVDILNRWMA